MKPHKSWFEKLMAPDSKRSERRPTQGFAAYYWTGSEVKQDEVRDISATGVYVVTQQRWPIGSVVSMTLQRVGALVKSERRITMQARAMRYGDDGVGLTFVPPADENARQWESLLESMVELTNADNIEGLVKMAEALAFLGRICPHAVEEAKQLVRGRLSNIRVVNAIEIALKAENVRLTLHDADKMRAQPHLAMRILEDGSTADEGWIQQLWAGLLATSCTVDGEDLSSLTFVDLLNQLAPVHFRIYTTACRGAETFVSESGQIEAKKLTCTMAELMEVSGSRELVRIERDLGHLCMLGLLAPRVKSQSFLPNEKTTITPTSVGLEIYARCCGHRGAPQDFYSEASPRVPMAVKGD